MTDAAPGGAREAGPIEGVNGSAAPGTIRLMHLSDIHFSHRDDDEKWDLNFPIRQQLVRDAGTFADREGPIDAVIVSGDIAFQASSTEYERASKWLDEVCSAVGCREEHVWVVPGNHDVDRVVVRQNQLTQALQFRLRQCPAAELDDLLRYSFNDPQSESQLLAPLAAYNEFALPFGCTVSGANPFWETALPFGTDYRLLMRGMTTVFTSDHRDHTVDSPLLLGSAQYSFQADPNTFVLTVAHHPPRWLRDGDEAASTLIDRGAIQLWGHEHTHAMSFVDGSFEIYAGAVQPYRADGWDPRYNFITISALPEHTARVCVYPRKWNQHSFSFEEDRHHRWGYPRCEDIRQPGTTDYRTPERERPPEDITEEVNVAMTAEEAAHSPRRLAFRFGRLAFEVRLEILREMGLLTEYETLPRDQELIRRAIERATLNDRIDELRAAVDREYEAE